MMPIAEESSSVTRRTLERLAEEVKRFAERDNSGAAFPALSAAAAAVLLSVAAFSGGVIWDAGGAGEKLDTVVSLVEELKDSVEKLRVSQQATDGKVILQGSEMGNIEVEILAELKILDNKMSGELQRLEDKIRDLERKLGDVERTSTEYFEIDSRNLQSRMDSIERSLETINKGE